MWSQIYEKVAYFVNTIILKKILLKFGAQCRYIELKISRNIFCKMIFLASSAPVS